MDHDKRVKNLIVIIMSFHKANMQISNAFIKPSSKGRKTFHTKNIPILTCKID